MAKYRKKPVVVDAELFTGGPTRGVQWTPDGMPFVITIHLEPTKVEPGDWIIEEPDGIHYYPCKSVIFEATYEAV